MTGLGKSSRVFKLSILSADHTCDHKEILFKQIKKNLRAVNSVSAIILFFSLSTIQCFAGLKKGNFLRESLAPPFFLTQAYHISALLRSVLEREAK